MKHYYCQTCETQFEGADTDTAETAVCPLSTHPTWKEMHRERNISETDAEGFPLVDWSRFEPSEAEKAAGMITKSAVHCTICQSPADRYLWGYKCQSNPAHMGDLVIGIFSDMTYPGKEQRCQCNPM